MNENYRRPFPDDKIDYYELPGYLVKNIYDDKFSNWVSDSALLDREMTIDEYVSKYHDYGVMP
jgi:hypothetical protein